VKGEQTMKTEFLSGRVAVLCGRSNAMSAEVAQVLRSNGATVVIVSDDDETLISVTASLKADGIETATRVSTLDTKEEIDRAFASVVSDFGRIDVLVNLTRLDSEYVPADLESMDLAEWRHAAADEPTMVLLTSQSAGSLMREQGSGRIINVSSDAAEVCVNADGVGKIMVQGFTLGFARELGAYGVTVNAVASGPAPVAGTSADSALAKQALKQANTGTDVGRTIAFLASDFASDITGQIIHVNGGFWMRPA
jgi:NAD(P)-dependent dehydrogenase (short-subunit alcohol dehydrogenase family)